MICYDVSHSSTFRAIDNYWLEEIGKSYLNIPKVLCGLKSDLYRDPMINDKAVIALLKNGQGIVSHVTCSAEEGDGITDVF